LLHSPAAPSDRKTRLRRPCFGLQRRPCHSHSTVCLGKVSRRGRRRHSTSRHPKRTQSASISRRGVGEDGPWTGDTCRKLPGDSTGPTPVPADMHTDSSCPACNAGWDSWPTLHSAPLESRGRVPHRTGRGTVLHASPRPSFPVATPTRGLQALLSTCALFGAAGAVVPAPRDVRGHVWHLQWMPGSRAGCSSPSSGLRASCVETRSVEGAMLAEA
jgi:hypothetical protein